jgi:dGTPase
MGKLSMEWKTLLSEKRLGININYPYNEERYPVSEFEKDYEKIITSAAFRRLQDKTQVFPLDKSDFIRTRLTHSIETATIAKRMAGMIVKNINIFQKNDPHRIDSDMLASIENSMMCAGLLHDLGNPPFGHFGEVVIGEWFQTHLEDKKFCFRDKPVSLYLSEQMQKDLIHFEGNAQTIRILTKLYSSNDLYGMNLTTSVLNTLIKYPTDSLNFNDESEDIKLHKLGYFFAEKNELDKIVDETQTRLSVDCVVRHPLTYILEAADDIAYAAADLEDAYKKGMFTLDGFINLFNKSLEKRKLKMSNSQFNKTTQLILDLTSSREKCESESAAFHEWIEEVRNWLIYSAAYGFTNNYKDIMKGSYKNSILDGTNHEYSLKIMKKDIMGKFVYRDHSILKLELSAQTIIHSLLNKFIPAILEFDEENEGFKQSKAEIRLTDLISENYKESYRKHKIGDEGTDLYLRFLLVTDFISGMTDTYAKDLYQAL